MMRLAHHLRDFEPGWISSVCVKNKSAVNGGIVC